MRMCACRGTAGFAHVSCLAEQAKILLDEVEENNLGTKAWNKRWVRWYTCSLCEQEYHGVMRCALGWACWKTYLSRPEEELVRRYAMSQLSDGLNEAIFFEDELQVLKAITGDNERFGLNHSATLSIMGNLAGCLYNLDRMQECLDIQRDIYAKTLDIFGPSHEATIDSGMNLAIAHCELEQYSACKAISRKLIPVSKDLDLLRIRRTYAYALVHDPSASIVDLREAVATLTSVQAGLRQLLGANHPQTQNSQEKLEDAQETLAARVALESSETS